MADTVKDELWAWKGLVKRKNTLALIPLAIFWVLWKGRSRRVFEGVEEGIDRIREREFQILGFFGFGLTVVLHGRTC